MKMLCLDMDGTIADLYHVNKWLDKILAEDPSPYAEAKPIWDMGKLTSILSQMISKGWEIRVITWLSKGGNPDYNKKVRQAKKEWLDCQNFPRMKTHVVKYGTRKASTIRKKDRENLEEAILVDDDSRIRKSWNLGRTIDPTNVNLLEALEELL